MEAGGMGDLPGPPSEENVAMLPKKRNETLHKRPEEEPGYPVSPPDIRQVNTTPPLHEQNKVDALLDWSLPSEMAPLPPVLSS
ncbi:uncharacterized protein BT62DRAFT_934750, partial [Guyanagaster necrorhizus]